MLLVDRLLAGSLLSLDCLQVELVGRLLTTRLLKVEHLHLFEVGDDRASSTLAAFYRRRHVG